jgi:hypothetical protein
MSIDKNTLYRKNWKRNLLKNKECGDCGVEEGELHKIGCDLELCSICGEQFITCDCDYHEKLENRVPFIWFPNICEYCGELWPELFMDDDWEKVLPRIYWRKVLCPDCWQYIKGLLVSGKRDR